MRNEVLHGYLIHQRKYRDRSYIVHLFTQEYGRIDGILRQNPPPQYQPITLQASGKSDLKNFSKVEILQHPVFFSGDAFFSGFYLNELLLRLCPIEVEMLQSFLQYTKTIEKLQFLSQQHDRNQFLKQILRQFEHQLLEDLGFALDFGVDSNQNAIEIEKYYTFQLNSGFIPIHASKASFNGQQILSMLDYKKGREFNSEQLQLLSKLYRQMIAMLLGDRPLKSRQLWIQNTLTFRT